MRKDPTEFRKRFAAWKNGKLPYKDGKPVVLNNYTNAKFNDDGTFTDDTTKVFDDFYVTPSGVKTKYGSYTDTNWDRYKQQEAFFKTHDQQTGKVKYEPGLEIVSPEFDLLTGIRALMPTMNTMDRKVYRIAREMNNRLKKNPILGSQADKNQFAAFVDNLTVGTQKALYLAPRKTSTPTQISWEDAQKPLSAQLIFPNEAGEGWLKTTADRLGVNINHYYNNIITPEELMQSVKNNGWEHFISGKTFTEPAYIPSGFPYGLDKSRILMPYDEIRKMPMMAKYANLPEAEFRKVADDLIGSHEFIHWWNRQLAKNIKSGRMKIPKGCLEYELTWTGENLPDGIDPDALGKTLGYMSEMNGTESNARLGQLFNAFGIKKGELRPQHINLALKFYRKVFPDNQMSIFLNAIKDKNALVKFANENAGTLFGTGTAVTAANKYAE